jgi:hypothetical protein
MRRGASIIEYILFVYLNIMAEKITSEQQDKKDIANADQIDHTKESNVTKSDVMNSNAKENKPIVKAPETICDAKDLVTAIKAKHQDNKEELTKLKGTSEASKRVMEMIEKRPPDMQ